MKNRFPAFILILSITIASCGQHAQETGYAPAAVAGDAASAAATDSISPAGSGDAAVPLNDPARKIIKTSSMRCRVTNVYQATAGAERLVHAMGGQVAESRMENELNSSRNLPYKADSLKQVQSYTTTAHLTLRIPVQRLDTVLDALAAQAAFIDFRELKLDDVTLQYLSNQLKREAATDNDAAQRALALSHKTKDAIVAGAYAEQQTERRIDRKIEHLSILDQTAYATLRVDLYQPEQLVAQIVPDVDRLLRPGFGQQARLALSNSWYGIEVFLVGMLQLWPLLVLVAGVVFLFRNRKRILLAARRH